MRESGDHKNISSGNLENLAAIAQEVSAKLENPEAKVLDEIKNIIRGLSSHKPSKRSGHAILVTYLLEKYRERVNEDDAFKFVQEFDFSKKTKKSAIRTVTLGKVTALMTFVRAKVFVSDSKVSSALIEVATIAQNKPQLQAYICACLAAMTIDTGFKFFEGVLNSINQSLDAFIFWFKIRPFVPEDKMELVPAEFRKSMFSNESAELITKVMHQCKQPWNSLIWKTICSEGTDEELLAFWQSIVMKEVRGANEKVKISTLLIVKSVFPSLRPSLYSIVICSSFVRLLNNFIGMPMLCEHAVDFLDFIVKESSTRLNDVLNAFGYIQAHLPAGFAFHRQIFDKCSIEQLKEQFEILKTENENQFIEFRQRIPAEKGDHEKSGFRNFRFDKLRALFISSALHNDPAFSILIFDTLMANWGKQHPKLVADLVAFDEHRIEGSATLSDLLKQPELSHFDSCYKLYSLCTGTSSSPSLDTIIPPSINDAEPSSDLILLAMQHSNEPLLIQHAYKIYLKDMSAKISADQLESFIKSYVPAEDTFTESSVDIIKVAVKGCEVSFNFMGPLFQLFCRTLTNCNYNVAMALGDLIVETLKRESADFSLQTVITSIFTSMNELPNRIVTKHEKLIQPVFSAILGSVIKSKLPLTQKCISIIEKHFDEAIDDFSFKSTPHFCLAIFTEFVKLPGTIPHSLFVPVLKHLPQAKKLRARVELINLITSITAAPKELDVLMKLHGKQFNACMNALLDEVKNSGNSKEEEIRQEKVLRGVKSWLSNIEKKRNACSELQIGDIKRRLTFIANMEDRKGIANGLLKQLQRIEQQIHVKQRTYE